MEKPITDNEFKALGKPVRRKPELERMADEFHAMLKRHAGAKIDINALLSSEDVESVGKGDSRPLFNALPEFYLHSFKDLDTYANIMSAVLHHLGLKGDERVLSVGSGPGFVETFFAKRALPRGSVVGIDNAEKMVEKAREVSAMEKAKNVEFMLHDAQEKLPFKDGHFDHVYSIDSLHWMKRWDKALEEMIRVTKPGGRIVFSLNPDHNIKLMDEGLLDKIDKGKVELEQATFVEGRKPITGERTVQLLMAVRKRA
jgi:SAM-dependent methyltransferase